MLLLNQDVVGFLTILARLGESMRSVPHQGSHWLSGNAGDEGWPL
jgi:hypothetical protein